MLQVYTGDGKGKTTAAFGQALRACGHGWRVAVIQFMKGSPDYGEIQAAKQVNGLEVYQFGQPTFVEKGNPSEQDILEARRGMDAARAAIASGKYQMIVMDEINVAVDYGLIPLAEVLHLIDSCPAELELVFTGRGARPEVLERAGLVSEVREIKHPIHKGLVNRVGIDR